MRLLVYARHDLVDCVRDCASEASLLLEGCWPTDRPRPAAESLDERIDGRFAWIDREAADLAESLGGPCEGPSPAYLNALALRYYMVKLIRPLAYLTEVQPMAEGARVELVAAVQRDRDYAEVLSQYCRAAAVHFRVRWIDGGAAPATRLPVNAPWRRCLAQLAGMLRPAGGPQGSRHRVVLCGNPRLLDPVCRELLARGCRLWWLHDRFAVRSWLRWQASGVGQLVCNASLGRPDRLTVDLPGRLECRGVNLAGPVRRWLRRRMAQHGPRQTRLLEQIDGHLRRLRPEALVLDEDATPMARAAVAIARRYGARSLVVQHGVPYCRFGFAPAAADRILVWGRSSQQRLIDWGVPAERIRVTGTCGPARLSPSGSTQEHDDTVRRRLRFLLLTSVPPRDDRPDAVALHLTGRTYAAMLRMAFAAVAEIDAAEIDGAELIVKLHPRAGDDPKVRRLCAEYNSLRSRVVRRGGIRRWLAGVDCVLSCGSSAGVEATSAGVPVVELAPPGAVGFLPRRQWGLRGTARSDEELRELLARIAGEGWRAPTPPDTNVFAAIGRPAAARIADEVLTPIDPVPSGSHDESIPTECPLPVCCVSQDHFQVADG